MHEPESPTPRHAGDCPVEDWMAFLGHRWTALVIWHLSTGAKRFGTLREVLPGVTHKVLNERLVALEQRGMVVREQPARFPREVSYRLSPHGAAVIPILDQLDLWARQG
ncbi:MAG: helix-turn-helix transcriptional regulator [Chloroflexota bacterium]|nr:helix-turn-helix transcriptional regulator [Chloroflexota bacterium]